MKEEHNAPIDTLFAKRVLLPYPKVSSLAHLFLADLLAASREGHLCIPAREKPPLPEGVFGKIVIWHEGRAYLTRNFASERLFLENVQRLKSSPPQTEVEVDLEGKGLLPLQQEAIRNSVKRSFSLICGGPGTGKTYTAGKLVEQFKKERIVLAAPTGKAASKLKSAVTLARKAATLHALLKEGEFLPYDVIVVDEGSMVDAALMARLFASVKEGARLILLGDPDQLPPVESGNLFRDLLAREKEAVTYLGASLRSDLKEILELAERVKKAEPFPYAPLPPLLELIPAILKRFDEVPSEQFRVLTPLQKGPYGAERLNKLLAQSAKEGPRPILITKNDAKRSLFNGDMGMLCGEEAVFPDGRKFSRFLLPPFEYAYVLPVHKSQGSEYDEVWLLLPEGAEKFGREMLYTGVTRAKKRVRILGAEGVPEAALRSQSIRRSGVNSPLLPKEA